MCLVLADALQGPQVDQDVDKGIEVGDTSACGDQCRCGLTVAKFRALDAQLNGLTVDALAGGALMVDLLVGLAVPIELITEASADGSGQGGGAAAF